MSATIVSDSQSQRKKIFEEAKDPKAIIILYQPI